MKKKFLLLTSLILFTVGLICQQSASGQCVPPSTPTGFTATAVSSSQINLSWNSVSGAIGYDIYYCNGTYIGFTSSTTYNHTGRVASTTYSYKIAAQKSASCVSPNTSCVSATTFPLCVPPSTPTGFTATAVSSSQINLSWNSVSGAIGYDIYYCDGTYITYTTSTTYSHTGRAASTTYSYKIKAQKSATCVSPLTSCVSATTPCILPSTPTGFTATAVSSSQINLSWNSVSGAIGYDIYYCDGTYITYTTSTTYNHTGRAASTTYSYKINAQKSATCVSPLTSCVSATTPCILPSTPTGFTATAVSSSQINLSWNSVSGAIGYDIYYCDGTYITYTTSTTYNHTGRAASTTYSYKINAQKSATCVSPLTSCVSATTPCILPSTPTGFTATAISSSQINLSWNSVSGAIGYDIYYCDGTYITYTTSTTYNHTGRAASTTYSYKINAQKSATCVSPLTSCVSATTPCILPSTPTGFTATAISSSQINLSWNSVSGAIGYDVYYCDGTYIGFTTNTTYNHTGRVESTTYSYKINAQKSATCVSPLTSCVSATTPCNLPSTPTGFTATAVSSSQIDLSWNSVPSAIGYDVYYCDGTYIGFTTNTTYNHTGRVESTTYSYKINAQKSATCVSPLTSCVSATTPCILPSTPTGFTATAISSSEIDLSWNSVPNATGYDIYYCDGTYIGFTTNTTYNHTGRVESTTYSYKIDAQKSATCVSPLTSCVSATTFPLCVPPSTPTGFTATAISSSQIDLSWNSVPSAIGYDIYYCDGTYIGFTTNTTYNHTGRVASTTYSYKIDAQKSATCISPITSCISATTFPCVPPSTPTGFTATAVSSSQINLSWNSVSGAIGYDIYYCDGTYITYTTSTTYNHTGRVASTTYAYKIAAQKSATCISPITSCISATTFPLCVPPSTPTGLTATAISTSEIDLSWNSVPNAIGYDVYYCNGTYIGFTSTTTYKHTGRAASTTYSYKIDAQKNAGCVSPITSCVSATTLAGTCVSWTGGTPVNTTLVTASEYLCQNGVIISNQNSSALGTTNCATVANLCYNSLFANNNYAAYSDSFPSPFVDVQGINQIDHDAINAMLYLEYADGVPCFSRDYYNVGPYWSITKGRAIRAMLESWQIAPDWAGYNPSSFSSSSFLCDVKQNDADYGYMKKAFDLGFLNDVKTTCGTCGANACFNSQNNLNLDEAYIILYRIMVYAGGFPPDVSNSDFFTPNTFKPEAFGLNSSIDRGIFDHYEKSSFVIPGGGLPLVFEHSYHSDRAEIPLLPWGFLSPGLTKLWLDRLYPLGYNWTYSYNSYILKVPTSLNAGAGDYRLIICWGDGSYQSYNAVTHQYESVGVHDQFIANSYDIYNNADNITIVKPNGMRFTFVKDAYMPIHLNLTEIKDKNNNTITLNYQTGASFYDPQANYTYQTTRLASVTDNVSARSLYFNYQNNSDILQSVTDNSSRSVSFNVNSSTKDLDNYTNPNGYPTSYVYGTTEQEKHLLISIQLPKGNTITNAYYRRKLQSTQNSQYSINVVWDQNYSGGGWTNSTVQVNRNSQTYITTYTHDSLGNPVSINGPTGATLNYTYGDNNNLTQPTTIVDNSTGISYSYSYDSKGNATSVTKNGGGFTQNEQFLYNNFSQVTSHKDPKNNYTTFNYNSTGDLIDVYEPNSIHTSFQNYTSYGKPQLITNPSNIQQQFNYNSYGNMTSRSIVGTSISTSATFDAVSRVVTTTDANQTVDNITYDNNDNITDEFFDPTGLNLHTHHVYDDNDNLTQITDPRNLVTTLTYDYNTDDLIQEYYGSYHKDWTYNTDGTVSSFANKNGTNFSYSYFSASNSRAGLLQSDGYATFDYNSTTKNLISVSHNGKTINYTYDGLNRVSTIAYDDVSNNTVQYFYDLNNNVTQIKYPLNTSWNIYYTYNENNRLTSIKDWNNDTLVKYFYLADGRLEHEELGNKTATYYFYDNAGRLDSIATKNNNGDTLVLIGCGLDNTGNHTYENLLVKYNGTVTVPGGTASITTYNYDLTNRIQSSTALSGNLSYASNNNGNITNVNTNGSATATMTWDERDNMLTCNTGGLASVYEYDPLENRRRNNSTRYLLDILNGSNVLVETDLGGTATALYVHGLGLVCKINPVNGQKYYYHSDFRGSVLAISDTSKKVIQGYQYDEFGGCTAFAPTGLDNHYRYVGKFGVMQDTTGFNFMRARYYDSRNGRFVSEDPVWGNNLFAYGGNNALSRIDPEGNSWITAIPKIIDKADDILSLSEFCKGGRCLGTYKGQEAHDYYESLYIEAYVNGKTNYGACVGMAFSSLWTPKTYKKTLGALVLGAEYTGVGLTKMIGKTGFLKLIDMRYKFGRGLKTIKAGYDAYQTIKKTGEGFYDLNNEINK